MKREYDSLFKKIIKSYYDDNFEEVVRKEIENSNINKNELLHIISSFCGVQVDFSENYIKDLKIAIAKYRINHKIVEKVKYCTANCLAANDGKTNCQKSCPFDAIILDKDKHTTYIDDKKCTDCGMCIEACPSNALLDKVEFIPLLNMLREDTKVIAAVAPSIIGQFGENVSMNQLRSAFKKIGFDDMIEVAFFADMLTIKEAAEFNEHVSDKDDFMISSCCCPMWVGLLKKMYNDLIKHVSPSVSPMIASGRIIKKLDPDCKVVFVGPCVAKKAEAKNPDLLGDIDYVLTFAEVKDIFEALDIDVNNLPEDIYEEYASREGRLYARTGGVSIAVSEAVKKLFPDKFELLSTTQANGIKECKAMLEEAKNGIVHGRFLEGMGCVGGCVGGPKSIVSTDKGTSAVNNFAETSEIKISVDSPVMNDILSKIEIDSLDDFKKKKNISIFERKF